MSWRPILFLGGLIYLVCTTYSFGQVDEDCKRMFNHADSSFQNGNYELALNKLEAAKLCADDSKYGEKVTELQIAIFNKIISERDEAIRLRKEQEELREDLQIEFNKSQEFLRVNYLIEAEDAIEREEFGLAVVNIDNSLEIGESNQTGLVIAKLFEKRPPELLDQLASISMFDLNPENSNLIAYLGSKKDLKGNDILRIIDKSSNLRHTVYGEFSTMGFDRSGEYLYGVIELDSLLVLGTDKYNKVVGVVKFETDLSPVDTIAISQILMSNLNSEVSSEAQLVKTGFFNVGGYECIEFTPSNNFLILSGYAINGDDKYPLRTWINLQDGTVMHNLGDKDLSDLISSFLLKPHSVIYDDSNILANRSNGIISINLVSGEEENIIENLSYIRGISISPDKKRLVLLDVNSEVSLWDNMDSVWSASGYELLYTSPSAEVEFTRSNQLAIEMPDHRLLLVTLNDDLTMDTLYLDGHENEINSISISRDRKSFVSCGEDAHSIIWSLSEGARIDLPGSWEGVIDAKLIDNGKELLSISRDGFLMRHQITETAQTSISSNPLAPVPEQRISNDSYDVVGFYEQYLKGNIGFSSSLDWDRVNHDYYTQHYNDSISIWRWDHGMKHIENRNIGYLDSISKLYFVDRERSLVAHIDTNNNISFRVFDGDTEASDLIKGKFSPTGKLFAFYNEAKEEFQIWKTENNPTLVKSFRFLNTSYPDFSKLLFSDDEHLITFPCEHDGKAIGIIDVGKSSGFIFKDNDMGDSYDLSPTGDAIVVAGKTGEVIFYSIETNKKAVLGRHSRYVSSVSFSSSGKLIASGSRDRTVRLWSVDRNIYKPEYSSYTYLNPVESVAFSPDDSLLISLSGSRLNFIPTTRKNLIEDYKHATYLDSWGELYNSSITSPDSILAILPVSSDYSDRSTYAAKILERKIVTSEKNRKETIARILNTESTINERTKAIVELSMYKDKVLNSLTTIKSIFSSTEFQLSDIQNVLASELFPFTGNKTERSLIALFESEANEQIQFGILQLLVELFPSSSRTNLLLESNFDDDSENIRLFSALHSESLGDENQGLEILVNGISSELEVREMAFERIQLEGEKSVPLLIHKVRSFSPEWEGYPLESGTYQYQKTPEGLVTRLILDHGAITKSYLRDSINEEGRDIKFKSNLIKIFSQLTVKNSTDLDLYIAQIQEHIADTLSIELIQSCLNGIDRLSIDISRAGPVLVEVLKLEVLRGDYIFDDYYADWILSKIGSSIVPIIVEALPNTNQKQRDALYSLLVPFSDVSADVLPYLLDDIKTTPSDECSEILELLGAMGTKSADALPELYSKLQAINTVGYYYQSSIIELIDAIVQIKSKPKQSTDALLDKMEKVAKSDSLVEYYFSNATIKALRKGDVPESVIRKLEQLDDVIWSIDLYKIEIEGQIGHDDFEIYQELILKYSEHNQPHDCNHITIFSEGLEAIAELDYNSSKVRRRLRRLKSKTVNCTNIQSAIEKLLIILDD